VCRETTEEIDGALLEQNMRKHIWQDNLGRCLDKMNALESPRFVQWSDAFWLFMIGSVLGFILEGLNSIIHKGRWENHSATVWGPFCIIYGIGAVVVCLVTYILNTQHVVIQYIGYALVGSIVEYVCGLFQEVCFVSRSWDYSKRFMNLQGRICLYMACLWGILGLLFARFLFQPIQIVFGMLTGWINTTVTILAMLWMLCNLLTSAVAVLRWRRRTEGHAAQKRWEFYMDKHYNDAKMKAVYGNMQFVRVPPNAKTEKNPEK